MTTKVQKVDKASLARIQGALEENGLGELKVGSITIDDRGNYRKISAIKEEEKEVMVNDDHSKPKRKKVKVVKIYYQQCNEEGVWEDYGSYDLKDFIYHRYNCVLPKSIKEMESDVIASINKDEEKPKEEISESTEITTGLDKKQIQAIKDELEEKRNMVEAKRRVLTRMMEIKRSELYGMVESFTKQIKRVQRVIDTLELYLGINEDIIQIQEGENADHKTPIALRQQLLYMDEEVGDPTDQGLDFKNIDKFDEWLTDNKNYERVFPEEKGVVAIRVRRRDKYYSDDPFYNSIMNLDNGKTYFLIRNGENIYRVWGALNVGKRLFPLKKELQELLIKFEEASFDSEKEEIEDEVYYYRRNVLVLQGLIERTEIFQPISPAFNLLNPETYGDTVQFIYDDELALPTDRKPYQEWQKEVNKDIKRGSRVFVSGVFSTYGYRTGKDFSDRFLGYRNEYNYPKLPHAGIYTVDDGSRKVHDWRKDETVIEKYLSIKYNPKDTLYGSWGDYDPHERKNRITFIIEPDDEWVFNYDNLDLDDVEFYINSRIDRESYLDMMPVLHGIRRRRMKELGWEKDFVSLTANEVAKELKVAPSGEKIEEITDNVWKAIEWWKNKVIWKRPIRKDDSKALRMIKSRIKRKYKIK